MTITIEAGKWQPIAARQDTNSPILMTRELVLQLKLGGVDLEVLPEEVLPGCELVFYRTLGADGYSRRFAASGTWRFQWSMMLTILQSPSSFNILRKSVTCRRESTMNDILT